MKFKKTLGASIISVVLSIMLLAGTTFAWFTDTVTNTENLIEMGILKVDLEKYTGATPSDDEDGYVSIAERGDEESSIKVFDNNIKWEPGRTEIVYLKVQNEGNLALNYNINLKVQDVDTTDDVDPIDVFEYAIIDGLKATDDVAGELANWTDIKGIEGVQIGSLPKMSLTAAENGALLEGESDYFALAVHMDESATNEYMGKKINIDIQLVAKQMVYESGSLAGGFDADAEYSDDMWLTGPFYLLKQDFEGDSPVWYPGGSSELDQTKIKYENHEGNTYVTFGADYGSPYWMGIKNQSNNIGLQAGETYTLSCRIRNDKATGDDLADEIKKLYGRPAIYLKFDNTNLVDYKNSNMWIECEGNWVEHTITFTVPDTWGGTDAEIGIWNYRYKDEEDITGSKACGNISIDDFFIYQIAE